MSEPWTQEEAEEYDRWCEANPGECVLCNPPHDDDCWCCT